MIKIQERLIFSFIQSTNDISVGCQSDSVRHTAGLSAAYCLPAARDCCIAGDTNLTACFFRCVHPSVQAYVCACVRMYTCASVHENVCASMQMCMCLCVHVFVCACLHLCMRACICVCHASVQVSVCALICLCMRASVQVCLCMRMSVHAGCS